MGVTWVAPLLPIETDVVPVYSRPIDQLDLPEVLGREPPPPPPHLGHAITNLLLLMFGDQQHGRVSNPLGNKITLPSGSADFRCNCEGFSASAKRSFWKPKT